MKRASPDLHAPPPFVPPGDCSLFFGGAFGAEPGAGANRLLAPTVPVVVGVATHTAAGDGFGDVDMPVEAEVGDMLLFHMAAWDTSATWSPPVGRGINKIHSLVNLFVNPYLGWKIATAEDFDPSPNTFRFTRTGGSANYAMAIVAVRGIDITGSPEEALNGVGPSDDADTNSPTALPVLTTRRRTLVISFCANERGDFAISPPESQTEIYEARGGFIGQPSITAATTIQPIAGQTPPTIFVTGTTRWVAYQIAIASVDSG